MYFIKRAPVIDLRYIFGFGFANAIDTYLKIKISCLFVGTFFSW